MTKVIVPPVSVEVDGAKCIILEVTERKWLDNKTHFLVSIVCEYKGKRSKVFDLDVTSNEELMAKLRTEVAKFKLMIMHGLDEVVKK